MVSQKIRLLGFGGLLALGCGYHGDEALRPANVSVGVPMNQGASDPQFAEVEPGSLLKYACSPKIDDFDFRGIVLNAPKEVYYERGARDPISGAFAPIVVCGSYCFQYDTLGLNGDFVESIVLVATNTKTNESYSGRMQRIENRVVGPPAIEAMGLKHEDFKDRVLTKYFNPNLATVLRLPEQSAEYRVWATLGTFKSNVVTIRVRERSE